VASILAAADSSDVLSPEFDQQLTSLLQPGTPRGRAGAAATSSGDEEEVSSSSSNGAAAASSSTQASLPVEQVKAPKDGPPPLLQIGDDDIHWVAQLHNSLMDAGYYPSDDDVENWFFGDSTQTALLTFQECCGLPQTGEGRGGCGCGCGCGVWAWLWVWVWVWGVGVGVGVGMGVGHGEGNRKVRRQQQLVCSRGRAW
jgi:hypothetical protein